MLLIRVALLAEQRPMILFALLSVLVSFALGCAPATGGISKTALLHFSVSPIPKYTYSDSPALGQTSTAKAAQSNVDKDLRSAIMTTLAENGIPQNMASMNYEYNAPKILLADGDHCTTAGTYVVFHGVIMYKCVEETVVAAKRVKRADDLSTAASTTEALSTTEDVTTTKDVSTATEVGSTTKDTETTPEEVVTTTKDVVITTEEAATTAKNVVTTDEEETTPEAQPTTKPPSDVPVRSEQYEIRGTVTVETPQPIFESQWNNLAEKIQEKLERHRVLFTENIRVELL